MSEETAGDFRYDTGETAIPWAAVGEAVEAQDVMTIIELLLRPGPDEAQFAERLAAIRTAVMALRETATPATKLTLGDMVQKLEARCTELLGVRHAVFLTNATAGFEIAFKFAGLQPGDEVIAPAITFIATICYPLAIGAKVVFADVDPRTLNMDPEDVARKVTDRTRAIIPVHLGGYPVDMAPIMELAEERDITVIEDAAHAFGGSYRGQSTGAVGHFGSFSFHEVKNITALGEGGLLITDGDWGEHLAKARFLGLDLTRQIPTWLYDVVSLPGKRGPFAAGNHSATEIQAACLLSQIDRLPDIIATRRRRAEYLNQRFAGVGGLVTPPLDDEHVTSTHHLYLLQVDPESLGGDIQDFKAKLAEKGVTNIPHFAPLYKFSLLRDLGYDQDAIAAACPNAEEAFNHRFTHLPLYPLTDEQVSEMADLVTAAADELRSSG